MKILIFSDSHGSLAPMLEIVESQRPQEVFHLGDYLEDAQALSHAYPDLPVTMVPGNCDGWTGLPGQLVVERGGVPILLSHGHVWQVKSGPERALEAARAAGAQVLLYGHTHRPVCRREGELWVCNPGAAGGQWGPVSYGVLTVPDGGAGELFLELHTWK